MSIDDELRPGQLAAVTVCAALIAVVLFFGVGYFADGLTKEDIELMWRLERAKLSFVCAFGFVGAAMFAIASGGATVSAWFDQRANRRVMAGRR